MSKFASQINKSAILFGSRISENGRTWNSREVLGFTRNANLLKVNCWLNAVAGGRMVIRLYSEDPTEQYDTILNQDGLLCLRAAMREHIVHGLGRQMNSEKVHVAGMTNLSPKNSEGYRTQFAGAFFPYQDNESKPQYSVSVIIQRSWQSGYASAAIVARKMIEYIHMRTLLKSNANENRDSYVPHRAEK